MKEYSNNSNPSWKEPDVYHLSAKETVVNIQNISKNIKEYSFRMRETVRTLRESGVIPEMAEAIRDGSLAVYDTVKDINEATQELKKNSTVVDTADAVENTLKSVEESIATVKEITTDAEKVSPRTTEAVQYGIDVIKTETDQVAGKVIESIKSKVGTR